MDIRKGKQVMWRGSWGRDLPKLATIVDIDVAEDKVIVVLDNGHWAYDYQLEEIN